MKRILPLSTLLCLCLVGAFATGESSAKGRPDNRGPKVCLCHVPPGNPGNEHTICVGAPAVRAHLAHGDTLGVCAEICGGTSGHTCSANQFCKHREGVCAEGAEGKCTDVPSTCRAVLEPVCGCDGMTYDNACFAHGARVTVDHEGPCVPPQACGAAGDPPCATGEFCKRPEGVCAEDARGECAPIPPTCPVKLEPVCGCDGKTYDNACKAAAAGVTIASTGECAETQACGGSTGVTCGEGQFCKSAVGQCADNAEGVCARLPQLCPAPINRVCGCDGKTYSNECMAHAAGVNVASTGACPETKACGGTTGVTCDQGQFCKADTGQCAADAAGVCTTKPDCCPPASSPVCGCDNLTYDNECFAAAAGVTVKATGACTP